MNQWVAFFLLTVGLIILALLIRRQIIAARFDRSQPGNRCDGDLDLSRLISNLGDPKYRDSSRNRVLSLGPQIIPELIAQLIFHRFHIETTSPRLISEIETLIIDFGPSAVQPVLDRLTQWSPTHRCAPSLVRMCRHLGLETIQTVVQTKRTQTRAIENLNRFLPHLLIGRPDIRTCPLFLTGPERRPATALLVSLHSREWATLWIRLCQKGQHALLDWLKAWPACVDTSFLEFLLLQAEEEFLERVFELTTLRSDERLFDLIREYTRHSSIEIRDAAIRTLSLLDQDLATPNEIGNADRNAACSSSVRLFAGALRNEFESNSQLLQTLVHECLPQDDADESHLSEAVFNTLCSATADISMHTRVALCLVYPLLESSQAIACERLLSLCKAAAAPKRIAATLSLALHRDQRALEGYRRCIQQTIPTELNIFLQQAAVKIGAPLARVIAGRLVAKGHGSPTFDRSCLVKQDGHLLLSQLRSIPFSKATDILLELIEADVKNPMTRELAMTLQAGGEAVRLYTVMALKQPERGLILPAVRYLGLCPAPNLLDELLHLLSDFDVVRNQVLTLVEYLDDEGLRAIERAIERGGSDIELDVLLETQSWFLHCVDRDSA